MTTEPPQDELGRACQLVLPYGLEPTGNYRADHPELHLVRAAKDQARAEAFLRMHADEAVTAITDITARLLTTPAPSIAPAAAAEAALSWAHDAARVAVLAQRTDTAGRWYQQWVQHRIDTGVVEYGVFGPSDHRRISPAFATRADANQALPDYQRAEEDWRGAWVAQVCPAHDRRPAGGCAVCAGREALTCDFAGCQHCRSIARTGPAPTTAD